MKITANNSKVIYEFVSETGKLSDGSPGRQTDYIILFYIKLIGHM